MPRNASGEYSLPTGTAATSGATATAAQFNSRFTDLESDANATRPITAGGTGGNTAAAARTALGLAIGSNVQAYDAALQSLSGLTLAADKGLYSTAADTLALFDLSAFGRTLAGSADASAARGNLGLTSMATATILDEDDMASDSDTAPATQQSIKAYVDTEVAANISFLHTAAATTSGSSVAYTSLLSSITTLKVMFNGVSLNGTDNLLVQIGDSGGYETSGYDAASAYNGSGTTSTSGFLIRVNSAGRAIYGVMTIEKFSGNRYVATFTGHDSSATSYILGSGVKELSGALDRIRIVPSGSDTFDAGSVNLKVHRAG